MSEDYKDRLYENLNRRDTDELLNIWQSGNPDEWQEDVFDLIEEILLERRVVLPPASPMLQVKRRIGAAEETWRAGNLEAASSELEQVLELQPLMAEAHHLLGLIHAERGEYPKAIGAYQKALQLEPELRKVRQDLRDAELAYEDSFWDSEAKQHLDQAHEFLRAGKAEQAKAECDRARESLPEVGAAHNELGVILEELGKPEAAILEYQKALQLDPELEEARYNLRDVEDILMEDFLGSDAKRQLDHALALFQDEQPDQALEACEIARRSLPPIAPAYNLLGLILEGLERLKSAEEVYLQAISCNPRFFAARENLANVRLKLEAEEYRQAVRWEPEETGELETPLSTPDELQDFGEAWKDTPLPGWVYQDETAQHLIGWPGYRTRPGRTGYDPLARDFEYAHIMGVILRRLFTLKMRTRNPLYLLGMTIAGLTYCLPLFGLAAPTLGESFRLIAMVILYPHWIPGISLVVNVAASLIAILKGQDAAAGHEFF